MTQLVILTSRFFLCIDLVFMSPALSSIKEKKETKINIHHRLTILGGHNW